MNDDDDEVRWHHFNDVTVKPTRGQLSRRQVNLQTCELTILKNLIFKNILKTKPKCKPFKYIDTVQLM